jgi:hypothetical protein
MNGIQNESFVTSNKNNNDNAMGWIWPQRVTQSSQINNNNKSQDARQQ